MSALMCSAFYNNDHGLGWGGSLSTTKCDFITVLEDGSQKRRCPHGQKADFFVSSWVEMGLEAMWGLS